jgi:hypothetical protein
MAEVPNINYRDEEADHHVRIDPDRESRVHVDNLDMPMQHLICSDIKSSPIVLVYVATWLHHLLNC